MKKLVLRRQINKNENESEANNGYLNQNQIIISNKDKDYFIKNDEQKII